MIKGRMRVDRDRLEKNHNELLFEMGKKQLELDTMAGFPVKVGSAISLTKLFVEKYQLDILKYNLKAKRPAGWQTPKSKVWLLI